MKNSSDTIGNRPRDLPACSAVPQPTAPPRTPFLYFFFNVNHPEVITYINKLHCISQTQQTLLLY